MYAVIQTGSKQYRVSEGDLIQVEKLPQEEGKKVTFDKVFMVGGEGESFIGNPTLAKAKVIGEVMTQGRGKKVLSLKFRKRKGFKKTVGHRQHFTTVKITEIKS
ncbi:MAG: 50S ribosomal protein L21 [Deltaproteobacteria bacterium]|nr:50S ribosomal protein L21 [Deltaproteobacteria bacterium]